MNHIKLVLFSYSILLFAFSSCVLQEENAFTRVARQYENDTLKSQALDYLRKSVAYHYGVSHNLVDSAGRNMALMPDSLPTDSAYKAYLLGKGCCLQVGDTLNDMDALTDSFLKENIEMAFMAWRQPWAKDVPFRDFCKYILPYRNADEELSNWRSLFWKRYGMSIKDSVSDLTSIREVAEYLIRRIRRDVHYSTQLPQLYFNFLTPTTMIGLGGLECKALAHYTTLAMRACGIPCTMIELHWRFTEIPHTSVLFPETGSNSRAFRLTVGDTLIWMGMPKDSMATWRGWSYSYEPNQSLLRLAEDPSVPRRFAYPLTREDVTAMISTTHGISLPVPKEFRSYRHLFLCRFHDWNWYAIREGDVKGDSVCFRDATIRQWYRLGYMKSSQTITFGNTFTLEGNGKIRYHDMTGDTVNFILEFECPPQERRMKKEVTAYYWGHKNEWIPVARTAWLWAKDSVTGTKEPFIRNKRNMVPYAFRMEIAQPCWTVFTSDSLPRPVGFLSKDSLTGKDSFMAF